MSITTAPTREAIEPIRKIGAFLGKNLATD